MALITEASVNRMCEDPAVLRMDPLTLTEYVFTEILRLVDQVTFEKIDGRKMIEIEYKHLGTSTLLMLEFQERKKFHTTSITLVVSNYIFIENSIKYLIILTLFYSVHLESLQSVSNHF